MNVHSFIFAVAMRPRNEQKEQAIRQKALQMIVETGFDGLSMQKLAKAAGVSPATIYIYFKDRDDLILKLCVEQSAKMVEATLQNFDPKLSFEEGLKIQWLNRVRYFMDNQLGMHFLEQIKYSPLGEEAIKHMDQRFIAAMHEFVHNAIQRNELVRVPTEVYWSVAFAPMYNLVKFHINGKSLNGKKFVLTDEILLQTLALVIKALKP